MSSSDKHSKTEKATPKKVADARKEGQVAKSQDVAAWMQVLIASLVLPFVFRQLLRLVERLFARTADLIEKPDKAAAVGLLGEGMQGSLLVVAPLALGLMLVGVISTAAQVGLKPSGKALKPQLKRLNPLPGIKRIMGPEASWEAIKALLKLTVCTVFAYRTLSGFVPSLLDSGRLSLMSVVPAVASSAVALMQAVAAAGLVLAAVDYVMQRRKLGKKLMMTKQEVKDEHKKAEGDPMLKGAIRQRQMEMSRNRMMAEVANADVLLVNPTHVAVALKYDPASGAPRVVAKGAGTVAAKLREKASENRVPLVQDIPLARALHRSCELGDAIPPELYAAVARVLAFVFSLRARGAAGGTHALPSAGPLPVPAPRGRRRASAGTSPAATT
jgi:flagellar biosynthetic protein FlhB